MIYLRGVFSLFTLGLSFASLAFADSASGSSGDNDAENADGSELSVLVGSDVQSKVYDSRDVWLLELTSSPDQIMFQDIDGLTRKLSDGGVRVGALDCSDKSSTKVCKLMGFQGQNTVRLISAPPQINPYTKKNFRESIAYSGKSTVRSFESFISKNSPNHFAKLKTAEEVRSSVTESPQPAVFVVTDKETIGMLYRTVALAFHPRISFAHIFSGSKEACDELKVSTSPAIGAYVNGELRMFTGDMKSKDAIATWIQQFDTANVADDEPSAAPEELSTGGDGNVVRLDNIFDKNAGVVQVARVVAVVSDSAVKEIKGWKRRGEGAVLNSELRCSTESESHELYAKICGPVTTAPYLLVVPYEVEDRRKILESSSWSFPASSYDAAAKRAVESIPESLIAPLSGGGSFEQFLVMGDQKGVVSLVVFSDKPKPPVSLRNVAAITAGFAQVGFFPNPTERDRKSLDLVGVPLPTAIAVFAGPEAAKEKPEFRIVRYDAEALGAMRFESLSTFVVETHRLSGLRPPNPVGDDSDVASSSRTSSSSHREVVELNTAADWERECSADFKGICVVGFVGEDVASGSVVDAASKEVLAGAMKNTSATFKFFVGGISCLTEFAGKFGVDPFNTPAVAIYSPVKERSAVMKGSFSSISIKRYLDEVLRGASATFPLSPRPSIAGDVDCSKLQAAVSTESQQDEGMDDLMAEIRREEEAARARLQQELEEERRRAAEAKAASSKSKKTSTKKKTASSSSSSSKKSSKSEL